MNMKRVRMMAASLCAVILLCGFSVTAYAGGGEDFGDPIMTAEPTVTAEPVTEPEPVETENPFTPSGTGTVINNATDADGKEFFTITTPAENVFYLIIDRQRETENVYFLNAVTEADLLALAELPEETATPTPEPTPDPEPEPDAEPVDEQPAKQNSAGMLLLVVAVVLIGGGAGYYFKIYRPKHQAPPEEDYGGESDDYPETYEDEDYGDEEDADPGEPEE